MDNQPALRCCQLLASSLLAPFLESTPHASPSGTYWDKLCTETRRTVQCNCSDNCRSLFRWRTEGGLGKLALKPPVIRLKNSKTNFKYERLSAEWRKPSGGQGSRPAGWCMGKGNNERGLAAPLPNNSTPALGRSVLAAPFHIAEPPHWNIMDTPLHSLVVTVRHITICKCCRKSSEIVDFVARGGDDI